jgi:hypothetical protein
MQPIQIAHISRTIAPMKHPRILKSTISDHFKGRELVLWSSVTFWLTICLKQHKISIDATQIICLSDWVYEETVAWLNLNIRNLLQLTKLTKNGTHYTHMRIDGFYYCRLFKSLYYFIFKELNLSLCRFPLVNVHIYISQLHLTLNSICIIKHFWDGFLFFMKWHFCDSFSDTFSSIIRFRTNSLSEFERESKSCYVVVFCLMSKLVKNGKVSLGRKIAISFFCEKWLRN